MTALAKAQDIRRRDPDGQFGQPASGCFDWGKYACSATCLQFLRRLYIGKDITLDEVSRRSGRPCGVNRGTAVSEIKAFIRWSRLPYVFREGLSAGQVFAASRTGPVLVPHIYGATPEWRGYRYGRTVADGRPNGYARPLGKAGKTQLTGFEDGRHLAVLLGYETTDAVYWFDPNHDSVARPERVPYDVITSAQLRRLIESWPAKSRWAFIPTRSP
jgi:hypothetical protein